MRRLLALLACSLLPACGSRGTVDASDASASPAPMPQATAGRDVLGLLAKVPVVDARMRAALPLDRVTQGYRVAPTAWSRPFATLPRRSVEPTRIDGEGSGIWLEIRPLGLADVPAKEGPRGLVYADVAKDTDLVWIAGNGLAEELRVLRGPEAPSVARWKLGRGPGVPSLRPTTVASRRSTPPARSGSPRRRRSPSTRRACGARASLELVDEAGEATLSAALDTAGLVYPIVVDPLWMNAAGVLPATYYEGSGVLLPSGKVAIFGSGTKVVQIFDTSTRTFSTGSPLLVSRVLPPSFVLGSGKVLLAGDSAAPNAELWSETGSIATGPASTTRAETVPVHVGFGTGAEAVYFFGGRPTKGSGTILATAEKYVVSTGLFVSLASLPAGRFGSANAPLADGKILVAGGSGSAGQFDTGLLYDPGSNTYESLVSLMPQKQWYPQAIVLSSGKVLIVGGWASSYTPTAKVSIYDPSTKTFAAGPSMAYERIDFGYAKLSGNRHAVFGGHGRLAGVGAGDSLSTVEIYDEGTNSWSAGPSMGSIRERAQTVALGGDRVLVAGGVSGGSYSTTAELFLPDPVTCTVAGPGCANCVDGYCCDRPCTGQCEACDLAGSLGFCDYVVGGPVHGTRPACTPTILCGVGGACQTTCSTDLNCGAGKYCGGGACFTKKAAGVACAANNECSLGFCVDGVCCDTACTGQCVACDNPGKVGTCSNATGPTHGGARRAPGGFGCDGTGVCATTCSSSAVCGTAYRCDTGTSTCVLKNDLGAACAAPTDCKSNNCVDGVCCNTACTGNCQACDLAGTLGTCSSVNSGSPHGPRTCSPYGVCSLGACSSTCTDSTQCATGFFCVGGTCTNKKNPGEGCGSGAECKSGFCAAGVCCDRACTAECESCGLAGALGTCKFRPTTDSCGLSGCLGSTLVARGTLLAHPTRRASPARPPRAPTDSSARAPRSARRPAPATPTARSGSVTPVRASACPASTRASTRAPKPAMVPLLTRPTRAPSTAGLPTAAPTRPPTPGRPPTAPRPRCPPSPRSPSSSVAPRARSARPDTAWTACAATPRARSGATPAPSSATRASAPSSPSASICATSAAPPTPASARVAAPVSAWARARERCAVATAAPAPRPASVRRTAPVPAPRAPVTRRCAIDCSLPRSGRARARRLPEQLRDERGLRQRLRVRHHEPALRRRHHPTGGGRRLRGPRRSVERTGGCRRRAPRARRPAPSPSVVARSVCATHTPRAAARVPVPALKSTGLHAAGDRLSLHVPGSTRSTRRSSQLCLIPCLLSHASTACARASLIRSVSLSPPTPAPTSASRRRAPASGAWA